MAIYDPAESHDQNFKNIIVENPWDAITFAMPKCANFFRHEPEIIAIREETLKTFFAESFVRTDVPLLVRYDDVAFTFLIEHQHDPDAFSIHHLARYVNFFEEQHKRDVVPIVYFPNASAKNMTLKREIKSAFMGKRYHYFTYEAVFLKDKPAKKYLKSNNIIARLLLPFMRYSTNDWLEVLDSAVKAIFALVNPAERLRQNKYLDFLFYYFNLEEEQFEIYRAYKQQKKEEKEFDMISTIMKERVREGFIQGKAQEGQDLLLLMLPKRLGPMPPDIENSIRSLVDLDRIHSIMAQLMEIRDWNEVKQLLNSA